MTWAHLVTLLSVIGFLVTAAGLVGISFRVGRNAQTVNNYKDSAEAWEMKARTQTDEIAELHEKLTANDVIIKKLQDRVRVLEDLVNGQTAINALSANIDKSFTGLLTHIDYALNQVRDDIRTQHG